MAFLFMITFALCRFFSLTISVQRWKARRMLGDGNTVDSRAAKENSLKRKYTNQSISSSNEL